MSTKDTLQRFIFANMPIRGEFIHLQTSYETIINQHQYPPAIRQLLGEALCVAGLLSAIIKFEGRLTVQFRGQGKLKLLLAQCDNHFNLRGLAKWDGELAYEDLMAAFNDGVLTIILDAHPGENKAGSRYQGIVAWRGNSFVESIEGYFKDSEQLATRLWLCVSETAATGFLIQVVPASDKNLPSLEKGESDPNWDHVIHLTSQLECDEMINMDYQDLLNRLYPDDEIRIFPAANVQFACTCSRKRSADAIQLLGREEAEAELADKSHISVTCDFCNKEYIFDRAEVEKIFADKNNPPSNTHIH